MKYTYAVKLLEERRDIITNRIKDNNNSVKCFGGRSDYVEKETQILEAELTTIQNELNSIKLIK